MPKKKSKTTAKRNKKKTSKTSISPPFDRDKHVYQNDAFVELVKDAVRVFTGLASTRFTIRANRNPTRNTQISTDWLMNSLFTWERRFQKVGDRHARKILLVKTQPNCILEFGNMRTASLPFRILTLMTLLAGS